MNKNTDRKCGSEQRENGDTCQGARMIRSEEGGSLNGSELIAWLLDRNERYQKRPGGLGRKRAGIAFGSKVR